MPTSLLAGQERAPSGEGRRRNDAHTSYDLLLFMHFLWFLVHILAFSFSLPFLCFLVPFSLALMSICFVPFFSVPYGARRCFFLCHDSSRPSEEPNSAPFLPTSVEFLFLLGGFAIQRSMIIANRFGHRSTARRRESRVEGFFPLLFVTFPLDGRFRSH